MAQKPETVMKRYSYGITAMSVCPIPENALVISVLDQDGILIVTALDWMLLLPLLGANKKVAQL